MTTEIFCGRLPDQVALMRLILASGTASAVDAALNRPDAPASLRRLWGERREIWPLAKALQAAVDHRGPGDARALAASFDRAAALSPDAASALYGLGDPVLLDAATREVVEDLARRGALRERARILDIGCGAGRFEVALAGDAAHILALESSSGMAEAARRRCAGIAHVEVAHCDSGTPPVLPERGFDLALAVDCFPYIVQAGGDLASRWFAAVARALEAGGSFCLFNFSYRGDLERDIGEVANLGKANGLQVVELGATPLRCWDGAVFQLRKPRQGNARTALPV
jgi:SAM-dependent methyltransferase